MSFPRVLRFSHHKDTVEFFVLEIRGFKKVSLRTNRGSVDSSESVIRVEYDSFKTFVKIIVEFVPPLCAKSFLGNLTLKQVLTLDSSS